MLRLMIAVASVVATLVAALEEICPIDSYCPSVGDVRECPPNTVSPQGSISLLDCVCLPGYICTYIMQNSYK
jgi:hypothetical protein